MWEGVGGQRLGMFIFWEGWFPVRCGGGGGVWGQTSEMLILGGGGRPGSFGTDIGNVNTVGGRGPGAEIGM